MKSFFLHLVLLNLSTSPLKAEETLVEKAQSSLNSATRSTKKGFHRAQEALCGKLTGDNKLECLAKKVKNRAVETGDALMDKASEAKNAIDSDD